MCVRACVCVRVCLEGEEIEIERGRDGGERERRPRDLWSYVFGGRDRRVRLGWDVMRVVGT